MYGRRKLGRCLFLGRKGSGRRGRMAGGILPFLCLQKEYSRCLSFRDVIKSKKRGKRERIYCKEDNTKCDI